MILKIIFLILFICNKCISILKSKPKIKRIQEFHRILKKNGKLIIDINGPKSSFQKEGKFISEDIYETNIKSGGKIKVYCPQNKKVFSNLFQDFHVDELGEVKFNYFNFSEHNLLLASEKKINLIIQLMNILITNISRRLYFVDFLVDIKKNFKNLEIHLADNDRFSPALNLASTKNHIIPKVSDGKKKYLVAIKKIVKKNKINLIVCITNFDLEIFSNSKKEFASLNCMILIKDVRIGNSFRQKKSITKEALYKQ